VLLNLFSDDPVEFLATLLMQCVSFREGRAEPPLLFNSEHIEDIFKVLDTLGTGTITMYQYRTGDAIIIYIVLTLEVPTVEIFDSYKTFCTRK
jgi:hypothetical protein